jgi:RIO kinase 1
MSSKEFLDDKKLKKLDKELHSIIDRFGLDRKTEDEVFDKSTLRTLEKLISDNVIDILDFPISTGKEGNVFRAVANKKKLVAVKIYRISTSTFKHINKYIFGDPRFKSIRKTRRDIIFAWTKKEFNNLERLAEIGVKAPRPIIYRKNVLVMEYIGTKNKPAPLLKDVKLTNPKEVFETIIEFIFKMYKKTNLVHADISAFNILIHKNKPVLIDLGQGVLNDHSESDTYLRRDIQNTVNYFKKYNIESDPAKIYKKITHKTW